MLVVVGGHSRNIGKTAVVAGLIRAMPEQRWTAVKISQFGNGVCAAEGDPCGCETGNDHPWSIVEESEPGETDTGRYLRAGARRCFWARVGSGQLARAVPALRRIFAESENTIVESNSILQFFKPDLFLMVLDFSREDFKPSSLRFMDRAHAFLVVDSGINVPLWQGVSRGLWDRKRQFIARPPQYVTPAISAFVKARLSERAVPDGPA